VRVRGELWRAELRTSHGPLGKGEIARVVAIRGMTLLVEPGKDVLDGLRQIQVRT